MSCTPLTRDSRNPRNIELNDVLGNYSLTLIDSLSTLAILASAPPDDGNTAPKALADFQGGVAALVEQYGDGRDGPSGQGLRARGFDVDSKVQVFETVIRGVGGLLSAHLFAVGELPITGYDPGRSGTLADPIAWPGGFKYNGQLLRLALDLATRLLPAFYTQTGMPYPRVNLRHGIPFYLNSPLHGTNIDGAAGSAGPAEITETCSAGAGSLVLEFTVLSRLTGDQRFEQLAKRAFWAVWYRRSDIGLIGAGVDAEQGKWIGAFSVIGAGADSFFEYALKTHILLSGRGLPNRTYVPPEAGADWLDPNSIFPPLTDEENSAESFLEAWHLAHAAIKRHLYSDRDHPHYVNVNIWTGSLASQWIDSLGAYYSGLLTLAGELDEAIETNLLYTAVWTRYSALPERWSIKEKSVEGGLGWWPLRPEFIESTYHIYRATRDPWYLYVGEMVQRDIARRCWTECGWAGLQNVVDGEKSDRMESFFLGETAKYMYLLFDDDHPLNSLDAAFVFTTEGHPLIIPKETRPAEKPRSAAASKEMGFYDYSEFTNVCPAPPEPVLFTGSATAARSDLYHAAKLLDLHLLPNLHAGVEEAGEQTPRAYTARQNHTVFPWTLPPAMLPNNGTCARVMEPLEIGLEFASNAQEAVGGSSFNALVSSPTLERLSANKVRVLSISSLKLTFRLEEKAGSRHWRITRVNGVPLGRDEHLVINRAILGHVSDARFNLVRDPVAVKFHHLHHVVWASPNETANEEMAVAQDISELLQESSLEFEDLADDSGEPGSPSPPSSLEPSNIATLVKSFFRQIVSAPDAPSSSAAATSIISEAPGHQNRPFNLLLNTTGITPTGLGAAPLPVADMAAGAAVPVFGPVPTSLLPWKTVFAAGEACGAPLPDAASRSHHVIVVRRGGCSFSEKLARIPAFSPTSRSLQLVVMVSDDDDAVGSNPAALTPFDDGVNSVRPLLDETQKTLTGLVRRHPIAMIMVAGGDAAYASIAEARQLGLTRRYFIESQGIRVRNIHIDDGEVT